MKTFRQLKTRAAVALIFASIFLCVAAIVYFRYYRVCNNLGGIGPAFAQDLKTSLIFYGISLVWFFLAVTSFVIYAKTTRYYGGYVGAVLGRLVLFFELAGYILAIIFLSI